MRTPQLISGPWKGIAPSYSPQLLGQGYFADGRTFRFDRGRATPEPALVAGFPLPLTNHSDPTSYIRDVLKVVRLRRRSGDDLMLYITRHGLYAGDIHTVSNVTPIGGPSSVEEDRAYITWDVPRAADISVIHYVMDAGEWTIIATPYYPYLFRWDGYSARFEIFDPPRDDENLPILTGTNLAVFNERVVVGSPILPTESLPHGIGWFGVSGPFDTTFPTTGLMPLTGVPGPVVALSRLQEYLFIGKETGIYLGQKSPDPENPITVYDRLQQVGVSHRDAVVPIMDGLAVAFLGTDRVLYAYDGQTPQAISDPVATLLDERDPADAVLRVNPLLGHLLVCYPDIVLTWSVREKWWSARDNEQHIVDVVPNYVSQRALVIDDLPGMIDSLIGTIDELGGATTESSPLYPTAFGQLTEDPSGMRSGWVRTAEVRFPHPVQVSRLVLRVRDVVGAKLSVRHSVDGGATWSHEDTVVQGDIEGIARVFYDFVATSEQFTFELHFDTRGGTIEDAVLEIVKTNMQEEVPALTGLDFA